MLKDSKIAIVHDYLHEFGGAENVVNAIFELYPNADIYSSTCDRKKLDKANAFIKARIFYPKWKDNIPGRFRNFVHKLLVANLPIYFNFLDLSKYDLVLSSSAHFAKGVRTSQNQLHISYIHTPPRFLYGYPGEIRKRKHFIYKPIFLPLDAVLRKIDQTFSKRPDFLLCNSETVKKRIKKFYNRDATVINPFPQVDSKINISKLIDGDYYLVLGRLAKYKNVNLCIETCGQNNIKLKIAGTGNCEKELKNIASKYKNIEMLGFVSDKKKNELLQNCKAMLCTVKDEDFGMVPLESNMYGKPVVALHDAGYLETVIEGVNGVFFEELTVESLLSGIRKLEKKIWDKHAIQKHANKFNKDRFKKEYRQYVESKCKEKWE